VVGWFLKKKLEILVGVELICLGSLRETIQDSTGFCTVVRFNYDEIISPESKRSNGLLGNLCEYSSKPAKEL
jgi:hypothetical protein